MHPVRIAPSLLASDFSNLRAEIESIERAGCDLLHLDVMDGHFVPNLTFGPLVVEAIKRCASKPLDTHLMIADPWKYADAFLDAGSDWLTFHVEVAGRGDALELLRHIRARGCKAGLSLQPDTPVERLQPFLAEVDLVLVMSVVAGFGGQKFRAGVLPKVQALRDMGFAGEISMDGGIGPETIAESAAAGTNVFVAGTAVFGAEDRAARIDHLRQVAEKASLARDRGGKGGGR
ncbi:MAG: ribulose-phosphate 3-epimerase [Planctomycetes bacterium]|nr:ribulose-phosphate 3-epimerase [Planctomycetota bacterium]